MSSVRLNTNESPFPPPVNSSTHGSVPARFRCTGSRIGARRLRDRLEGHRSAAARVFCANGSNEVLQTLLLTYGGAGRAGLVFEPTYALHSHIAHLTGTEVLVGARGDDFAIDPDTACALIERHQPEIVFLCSPNNPTGTVEPTTTVEAVLDAAPGLVVVDEAYGEFATPARGPRGRRPRPRRDPHVLQGVVAGRPQVGLLHRAV